MDNQKSKGAFEWAKRNRHDYCKKFFRSDNKEKKDNQKIAIFMAGSPWAGKTEFINRMIHEDIRNSCYILDLDEIRKNIPWYNGKNAEDYQSGAIKILEKMIDVCNDNEYGFILDGTFWSGDTMKRNIERLIKKGYSIMICHIHFPPEIAWRFTISREIEEGRRIPLNAFLYDYWNSFENVKNIKRRFKRNVTVFFLKKELSSNSHVISEILSFGAETEDIDEKELAKFIQIEYNIQKIKFHLIYWFYKFKQSLLWKKNM